MAGITFLGQVGSTGTSTGPHKHVYVKDLASGQYIDPATLRSVLAGVRVGDKRLPALIKDKDNKYTFNPQAGITLTSKYGPRSAPTAGASTFHRGEDWALPEGTPVYFEGAGTYAPLANQGGYGNLATFKTPDNKYEIGFGHMKSLGKPASVQGAASPTPTKAPGATSSNDESVLTLLKDLLQPQQSQTTLIDQLVSSAVASRMSQKSPKSFLSQYSSMLANPYEDVLLNPDMLNLT